MKKILVVMISFSMLLAITACGRSNGNVDSNRISVPQTEADTKNKTEETESSVMDSETETIVEETGTEQADGSNILIAYFSRVGNMNFEEGVDAVTSASVNMEGSDISGNAQLLAKMVQEAVGGDMFFIETVEKYPAEYRGTTDRAKKEQNEDIRPKLASHVENMDAYDTFILIYIGVIIGLN